MSEFPKSGKRFNLIVAIVVSVLLWLYVVNVENPVGRTELNAVPVVLQGVERLEERGLMITDLSRQTVKIDVKGKRKTFLRLYTTQVELSLDVAEIQNEGEYTLIGRVTPDSVRADGTITLSEKNQFAVTVTVKNIASREIALRGEYVGTVAAGYEVDPPVLNVDAVEIRGPEDVVSRIAYAVATATGENIREDLVKEVPIRFYEEDGTEVQDDNLYCATQTVGLHVAVVHVYEVPLTIDLIEIGRAHV